MHCVSRKRELGPEKRTVRGAHDQSFVFGAHESIPPIHPRRMSGAHPVNLDCEMQAALTKSGMVVSSLLQSNHDGSIRIAALRHQRSSAPPLDPALQPGDLFLIGAPQPIPCRTQALFAPMAAAVFAAKALFL